MLRPGLTAAAPLATQNAQHPAQTNEPGVFKTVEAGPMARSESRAPQRTAQCMKAPASSSSRAATPIRLIITAVALAREGSPS